MQTEDRIFQEKMRLLKEAFQEGKIYLPNNKDFEKSFLKIKTNEYGMVDPKTVDDIAMNIADTIFRLKMEEEMRKTPLIEIQRKYIDMLEYYLGPAYQEMLKYKVTPDDIAEH